MMLRDRCSTLYDLASLFRGRRSSLDRWSGKIAELLRFRCCQLKQGGPENPKAKRQQTNLSNTDNWFISFSPLASFFLEDEHYGRIHCKFHFSPPAR